MKLILISMPNIYNWVVKLISAINCDCCSEKTKNREVRDIHRNEIIYIKYLEDIHIKPIPEHLALNKNPLNPSPNPNKWKNLANKQTNKKVP